MKIMNWVLASWTLRVPFCNHVALQSEETKCVIMGPGERYDISVAANQDRRVSRGFSVTCSIDRFDRTSLGFARGFPGGAWRLQDSIHHVGIRRVFGVAPGSS